MKRRLSDYVKWERGMGMHDRKTEGDRGRGESVCVCVCLCVCVPVSITSFPYYTKIEWRTMFFLM